MDPMKNDTRARILMIAGMIFGAALLRLMPHLPNFTPIAAIALFGGARLSKKWLAFAIPLGAMLVSDVALELVSPWGGFHRGMPIVYATFALTVVIGLFVGARGSSPLSVFAGALSGATLFYLTTNFGVWLMGGLYPPTLSGLVSCYVAAIPFYGYQLAGDLVYAGVLFGAFAWMERRIPALAPVSR